MVEEFLKPVKLFLLDLELLKKAKFTYKGFDYLVKKVTPKTLVADMWQVYDFECYVESNSSL